MVLPATPVINGYLLKYRPQAASVETDIVTCIYMDNVMVWCLGNILFVF